MTRGRAPAARMAIENVPCYRMWSSKSNDNGATWLADDTFSDVVSSAAGATDPNILAIYAGDYDYGSAIAHQALSLHGRTGAVAISGAVPAGRLHRQGAGGFCRDHQRPGLQQHHQHPADGFCHQPERRGGSEYCSSKRFHGERNSGELVCLQQRQRTRSPSTSTARR